MKPAERLRELAREAEGGCGELWSADIALLRAAADLVESCELSKAGFKPDGYWAIDEALKRVQEACDE